MKYEISPVYLIEVESESIDTLTPLMFGIVRYYEVRVVYSVLILDID
jgi:hypothetical protein